MTPRTPHPWAVVDGGRVLFHVVGSYPPEYAVDDELEALWRKGQKQRAPRIIIQLSFWEKAA